MWTPRVVARRLKQLLHCSLSQLIQDYESLVGKRHIRENKIKRIMSDLDPMSDEALMNLIRREGSEAEAALRLLLSRRFPKVPGDVLEQLVVQVQDVCTEQTWNRRIRRQHARSKGLLIQMFCGQSRHVFEQDLLAHVPVDSKENLLRQSTYQYLMLEAIRGRIKFLIGGPPCRTNSVCRYFPVSDHDEGPRPVRNLGESICTMDHDYLTGSEVAMRQIDDLLYLRYLVLFCIATECNRSMEVPDPGFGLEQPEDPEAWASRDADWIGSQAKDLTKVRPSDGFASFCSSPEWKGIAHRYNLQEFSFEQGPLLHPKRSLQRWARTWHQRLKSWIVEAREQKVGLLEVVRSPDPKAGQNGLQGLRLHWDT